MCPKKYWTTDDDLRGDNGSNSRDNGTNGSNLEKTRILETYQVSD
jgi:hypothetical protein